MFSIFQSGALKQSVLILKKYADKVTGIVAVYTPLMRDLPEYVNNCVDV